MATPSNLVLRPLRPQDLPALQDVRAAAFAPVFASFRAIVGDAIARHAFARAEAEQSDLLDRVCDPGSGHEVVVAEFGGEVVGFAAWTHAPATRTGEIGLNAVHPDHAGQGIGTAMYEHALDLMRQAGAAVAVVSTGGDPSHAPARAAYRKAGFGTALPSVTLYRPL
jgi:ribosomal protein S18 acetylase RimI-like enzyme